MNGFWNRIRRFRPPVVLSCIFGILFSAASIVVVATNFGQSMPGTAHYILYVCAAVFLTMAVWSIVRLCRESSPKERVRVLAHRTVFTGKLFDDFTYRTVAFTYSSLVLNAVFSVSKGFLGWHTGSWWQITLAAYYFLLGLLRFRLVTKKRQLDKTNHSKEKILLEWRIYRLCGTAMFVMTVIMIEAMVLIVKRQSEVRYDGNLIYVMAAWDFYCLISSIVYMLKKRKQHTPLIVAIKIVKFVTVLVAMLSLQTAMFSSFGNGSDTEFELIMSLATGITVCLMTFAIGLIMVIKSSKAIKQEKESEVSK